MKEPQSAYIVSYNEVNNNNFTLYFPEILKRLNEASHIAIDLEFTSLGQVRSSDMAHRYVSMKRTVETASIASIGISIIKKKKKEIKSEQPFSQTYECDNFNLLTLKQGDITIDSKTGTFLCNHGYSFDALFTCGIPFTPPSDIKLTTSPKPDNNLFNLWKQMMEIMKYKKIPIVLHNGLYDLMYIYHSFIDKLPEHFNIFIFKLSNYFPSGLYDTRYLAEKADFKATFLEYVFSKSDRLRQNRFKCSNEQRPYFEVQVNPSIIKNDVIYGVKRKREEEEKQQQDLNIQKIGYCKKYAVK